MIQKVKFNPLVKITVGRIHAILSNIQRPLKPIEKKKHQCSPWDRLVILFFFGLVQYWLDRLFGWCNPCLPDQNPTTKNPNRDVLCLFLLVAPASSSKELTLLGNTCMTFCQGIRNKLRWYPQEREQYVGNTVHRLRRECWSGKKQLHSINMLLARFPPTGRGSCYSTSSCTTSKTPCPWFHFQPTRWQLVVVILVSQLYKLTHFTKFPKFFCWLCWNGACSTAEDYSQGC